MSRFKSETFTATPASVSAFDDFLELVEIPSFKRKLRSLLLYYLANECEELPPHSDRFIEDMEFLFHFLDVVEYELKSD